MAAPHVTGAVALLAQQHPEWKAADFKSALTSAAHGLPGLTAFEQGSGRLDIARAATQKVRTTSGSVSLGQVAWPHAAARRSGTVEYTNDGDTPVVLHLAADFHGPAGKPAPAGMFTVTAANGSSTLTVPAHGTATATVTAVVTGTDTGGYGGSVVATGDDGTAVRTGVGVYAAPKTSRLTVTVLDKDGRPAADTKVKAFNPRTGSADLWYTDADGRISQDLLDGEYDLSSYLMSEDGSSWLLSKPALALDGDTPVTLDAREAKRVLQTVDRPGVQTDYVVAAMTSKPVKGVMAPAIATAVGGGTGADPVYATPTPTVTSHGFAFASWQHMRAITGTEDYNLATHHTGSIPQLLSGRVAQSSLAKVTEVFPNSGLQAGAQFGSTTALSDIGFRPGFGAAVTLPGRFTHYASSDIPWVGYLNIGATLQGETQNAPATSYAPGQEITRTWNQGPLTAKARGERAGDVMLLSGRLFSPAGAGMTTFSDFNAAVTGSSTLSRDGKQIAAADPFFLVAETTPGEAAYTYTATATRTVPWSTLGSEAHGTWTFRSATTHPDDATSFPALPLLNARLNGPVKDDGTITGGSAYSFDVTAESATGAPITSLGLQISYNDGHTWTAVRVSRNGATGRATLNLPAKDSYASIRLTAADGAGSAVDQSVIRSFHITAPTGSAAAGAPGRH